MDFQAYLDQWKSDYAQFRQLVESIPAELRQKEGLCGVWSAKQLIAHLAGWQREAYTCYQKYLAGNYAPIAYDIDAYNADSVSALGLLNWKETLETLSDTYEDLLNAAQALTEAQIAATPLYAKWLGIMSEEFQEHGQQVEDWLKVN